METSELASDAVVQRLADALDVYRANVSSNYDEVLHEVTDRVAIAGSLGKLDIGGLLFWKRLRADTSWVSRLMAWSDHDVRETTGAMAAAALDTSVPTAEAAARARSALSPLPGFHGGDALASALILAVAPDRMAVYDRRAQAALDAMSISLTAARGRYGRYMTIMEDLAAAATQTNGQAWTARHVDCALFTIGGQVQQ